MRRRVARKIEKRINAGAPCPRVDGRGYREGTRLRAHAKLCGGPRGGWVDLVPLDPPWGPLFEQAWRVFRLPLLLRPLGPRIADVTT